MTFIDNLNCIIAGQNLTREQAADMITEIFSGTVTPARTGAFMAALATKGETFEELAGAGITVAKHGNRSISSKCGSADVLQAWGSIWTLIRRSWKKPSMRSASGSCLPPVSTGP